MFGVVLSETAAGFDESAGRAAASFSASAPVVDEGVLSFMVIVFLRDSVLRTAVGPVSPVQRTANVEYSKKEDLNDAFTSRCF